MTYTGTYTKTHLEDYVENLYTFLGIYSPEQLKIEHITKKLGLILEYSKYGSTHFVMENGQPIIMLDNRISPEEQWQEFGHELCHLLRHEGNQRTLRRDHPAFYAMQEWQANSFSLHFCIPTFMLEQLDLPKYKKAAFALVAEKFGVSYEFAEERVEQWLIQQAFVHYGSPCP